MPITAFLGYAPDIDPTTDGAMVNCQAIVPTQRGYAGAPTPVATVLPALSAQCYGAGQVTNAQGASRLFAGTQTLLFESGNSTWTPRSATFTALAGTDRWRFAQLGAASIAASVTNTVQFIESATQFAACTANAPRGAIVEVANNFVMLFNIVDQGALYYATDTAHTDGWWCAAKGGYSDWTPSIDTEAATGRLTSTPGPIVGAKRFGYQIVAYKKDSMFLGTYVGGQAGAVWDWQLISGGGGAVSHEVIVDIGSPQAPAHVFMGPDNFYIYRGGVITPIGEPVNDAVFDEFNATFFYGATSVHDAKNKRVYFYYPVANSALPNKCVIYNYLTNTWGRDDRQIQQGVQYVAPGITYQGLGAVYATYDDFADASYNLAFLNQGQAVPAIFDTANLINTLTGTASQTSITSNDFGDETNNVLLTRVVPRFYAAPTTATCINSYRERLTDSLTTDVTTTSARGRFDVTRSAPWHRLQFVFTGDHEISGFRIDVKADGDTV